MTWRIRDGELTTADHTLVMGVVNMTPDSFSDGGRLVEDGEVRTAAAVAHGLALAGAGCDIVDVGGESTRPGAEPVDPGEEARRTVPVVRELAAAGVTVSIDTRHVGVAADALSAGAAIVNDITALADPAMATLVADTGAGVVLMHMQGDPLTMQDGPAYGDVVAEITAFLAARSDAAIAAGVDPAAICIDPGIGFGKTTDHNLEILRHIDRFALLGYPVLIGTSRKGFIGRIIEEAAIDAPPPHGRDPATMATVGLAIAGGASVVRVHDGAGAVQAARVADAIVRRRGR